MLTEEQAANAYEEVTDGCRRFGSGDERQCSALAAGQAGPKDPPLGFQLAALLSKWFPPTAASAPGQNPLCTLIDRRSLRALARCSFSQRDWHSSHHSPLRAGLPHSGSTQVGVSS
jgi:hypothetical protein